ncbi:MAG: tetratricopeptide repeat protein [Phycisphaerales bacterium]
MTKSATGRTRLFAAALLALTVLAYLPALHSGYIWDDDQYVTLNQNLRSVQGLADTWFKPQSLPQYYPLVHTTFWIEYHLWGLNPLGYHIVNVLLHAICAILLWRLLRRLKILSGGGGEAASLLAAAIFALHPIEVESVAWITERKNVLSMLCYLLAIGAYLRFDPLGLTPLPQVWERSGEGDEHSSTSSANSQAGRNQASHPHPSPLPERERGDARHPLWWAAAMTLFIAALLSKSVTASLPAAILLLIWWKRGRITRRDFTATLPFFILGAAMGLYTVYLERTHVGAFGSDFNFSFIDRCLIAGRALWFYAGQLLWPANLIFIYPRWRINAADATQYLYPGAAIIVTAALWFARRRIGRGPLAAWLFFVGTMFPAMGFLNVYPFIFSFVADHFQYHAGIGLVVLGSCAIMRLMRPASERQRMIVVTFIPLVLAGLTFHQCRLYYKDEKTLWTRVLERNPSAWMAHNNLGTVLLKEERFEEALSHFQQTLRMKPDHSRANKNMGAALLGLHRYEEAVAEYRTAMKVEPLDPYVHCGLGLALQHIGQMQPATDQFRAALKLKPDFADAHNYLAASLLLAGQPQQAIAEYREAIRLQPDHHEAHTGYAYALQMTGRPDEAAAEFAKAIQLKPELADNRHNLAAILQLQGRVEQAVTELQKVVAAKPTDIAARLDLAYNLEQLGRHDQAAAQYEQALRVAPNSERVLMEFAWFLATCPQSSVRDGQRAVRMAERIARALPAPTALLCDTLAACYAESGDFDRAIQWQRKAVLIAPKDRADQFQQRLELYQRHQPYRSPIQAEPTNTNNLRSE